MSTVQEIETAIEKLGEVELAEPRAWLWDLEIERDTKAGLLDNLAREAVDEFKAGRTTSL